MNGYGSQWLIQAQGFELKAGTSFDTAWQLAHDMQNHITGIIVE
jgi:hypothetical protein